MQLKGIEKKEKNQVELTISIDKEEFEKALERAYRKNVGKMTVPGFRKGKAPRKIIEKLYGEGVFFEDAVNMCYPQAYDSAVEESKIQPVDHPQIDVDEISPEGFTFKATVTVKPEVSIHDYKGLSVEKGRVSVTEKDVKDLFEVKRRIEVIATRRAAENISPEGLKALKDNIEQQEFFAQKGDAIKVRDLDTEFHDIIYKECGSTTFESILSPIHHKMMKYRRISLEKSKRIMASVAEHKALYNAIAEKDGDKVDTLMLVHIDHAYNSIMEVSGQYGTDNSTENH